jgi:CBS domain-containing protein
VNLDHGKTGQWLYPIIDENKTLVGVLTRRELQNLVADGDGHPINATLGEIVAGKPEPIVAYPNDPLRIVVQRMAASGLTRFPVVDRRGDREHGHKRDRRGPQHVPPLDVMGQGRGTQTGLPKLVGLVSLNDLLKARVANLEAERKRERVIPFRIFPLRFRDPNPKTPAAS